MNRISSIIACAFVAGAALLAVSPASAANRAGLAMDAAFNPTPPRQGNETITVTLQDVHHKPISNADVTIATSMPTMSMGGPTIKATPSRAGVYVAKLNLNFATQWNFEVSATAGHQSIRRSYTQNVK